MELKDVILLPLSLLVVIGVGLTIRHLYYRNGEPYARFFMPGLLLKIAGVLGFCAIYKFYYGGGDTTAYFDFSAILYDRFFEQPNLVWQVWSAAAGTINSKTIALTNQLPFYAKENTFMVVRITALIGLLSGNSFWATSVYFAAFSFSGAWAMYRAFTHWYPALYKPLGYAVFALPSVVFWGSGILKDTIALSSLGWLLWALHQLFIQKRHFLLSGCIIWVSVYLISVLKAYILLGFLPAATFWILGYNLGALTDVRLKAFIVILSMVALGAYSYTQSGALSTLVDKFFQQFVKMAIGFQSWHSFLAEERGQTGYSLGEVTFTPLGILSKFPAAVNVTLFRPYLFEARNPVAMITALESAFMLLFTLYVLFVVGLRRFFGYIFGRPEILLCFIFTMIFAFSVGFSSYNFGALARYKIPCLPFYAAMLVMILHCHRLRFSRGVLS